MYESCVECCFVAIIEKGQMWWGLVCMGLLLYDSYLECSVQITEKWEMQEGLVFEGIVRYESYVELFSGDRRKMRSVVGGWFVKYC